MRRLFKLFAISALVCISCSKENGTATGTPDNTPDNGNTGVKVLSVSVETKEATEITETEAVLSGNAKIENLVEGSSVKACFYYSAAATTVEALVKNGVKVEGSALASVGGEFTASITGLQPNTTCNFVAVVAVDGKEYAGEVKHFTTAEMSAKVMISTATNISETKATLNAAIISGREIIEQIAFILMEGNRTSEEMSISDKFIEVEPGADGTITVAVDNLKQNCDYSYCILLRTSDSFSYTDEAHFKTKKINVSTELQNTHISGGKLVGRVGEMAEGYSSIESVYFLHKDGEHNLESLKDQGLEILCDLGDNGEFDGNTSPMQPSTQFTAVTCVKMKSGEVVYGNIVNGTTDPFTWKVDEIGAVNITETSVLIRGKYTLNNGKSFKCENGKMVATVVDANTLRVVAKNIPCELNGNLTGEFSVEITGLDINTWYSARVEYQDQDKVKPKPEEQTNSFSFCTLNCSISVSDVNFVARDRSITLTPSITNTSTSSLGQCTVKYYYSKDETNVANIKAYGKGVEVTEILTKGTVLKPSYVVNNLTPGTKYNFVVEVACHNLTFTSRVYTCSTLTPDVVVSLTVPSLVTANPSFSGNVSSSTGEFKAGDVSGCIVCLSTVPYTDMEQFVRNAPIRVIASYSKTNGNYSADVSGLDIRSKYYVVTVVSAYGKAFYSPVKTYGAK